MTEYQTIDINDDVAVVIYYDPDARHERCNPRVIFKRKINRDQQHTNHN